MYQSCVIWPYSEPSVQLAAMATYGKGFRLCKQQQQRQWRDEWLQLSEHTMTLSNTELRGC
jgi:hypothetical protein